MNLFIPEPYKPPRKDWQPPKSEKPPKWQKWIDMEKTKDIITIEQLEAAGFEFEEFLTEQEYNNLDGTSSRSLSRTLSPPNGNMS